MTMNVPLRRQDFEDMQIADEHSADRLGTVPVEIGLSAAIVSVSDDTPVVMTVPSSCGSTTVDSLPSGPFSPLVHRTLDIGLRAWVSDQADVELGYVEQLYTFGDRGRHADASNTRLHNVSIGYLALTRSAVQAANRRDGPVAGWRSWYDYFPWEDWRTGKPDLLTGMIEPLLLEWLAKPEVRTGRPRPVSSEQRVRMAFGLNGGSWDEERVLDRYELLYEAGLVEEARRDGREASANWDAIPRLGTSMLHDHRRILATAIGRLRGKIKYRPVVFELMPDEFTLFELQKTVEAILGPHLHKQNFRRLVESAGLVEQTGDVRAKTGGRPAKLYRFRREVLLERPAPGVRIKSGRM